MAQYWLKYGNSALTRSGSCVGIDSTYNPYNPLGLPPYTIRAKFSAGYTPAIGDSQTLVDAGENIWDITKNSTSWTDLFAYGSVPLVTVIGANSTGVTAINSLFSGCSLLTSVCVFDTRAVRNARYLFNRCSSLLEAPQLPLGYALEVDSMFYGCSSLASIPVLDLSSAASLLNFARNCSSLRSFPALSTGNVTNMNGMLAGCTSLTEVPMLDTHNVTNMGSLCADCSSLRSFPVWNTANVTNMKSMFSGAYNLLEVPAISTANATDMSYMFNKCTGITRIPLMDTAKATNMSGMWDSCTAVETGALALYQQASTQTTPPGSYTKCFNRCGSGNASGQAELAQIPRSWGGTMAE